MKKGIVMAFFFLFCFSLAASATCGDDQTIMRLYSPFNSHVSAWDKNVDSYLEEVCYDEVFDTEYVGADPHACNGANRVLSLNADINAHASQIHDVNYDYDVCYGDLSCEYDSSVGDGCDNGGMVVSRMYSSSNSHVSQPSNTDYSIKVCCTSGNAAGVYWADMEGNLITTANFGDTVQLIASGLDSGTFNIREEDVIVDDDIRSIEGQSDGARLIGLWTIESEDLDKTEDDYDGFYFEVDGERSDYLSINPRGDDLPINITVISPVCGSYYDNNGIPVEIAISAKDQDDLISGEVRIDGTVVREFSNGKTSFNYTFETSGNSQVVVDAFNSRGKRSRSISSIMILEKSGSSYVDGEYVAACILEPKDFSNIMSNIVQFDASSTRGVRIVDGAFSELIPGRDAFSWYWNFMPEDIDRAYENSMDPFAYRFNVGFSNPGQNSASLNVEI